MNKHIPKAFALVIVAIATFTACGGGSGSGGSGSPVVPTTSPTTGNTNTPSSNATTPPAGTTVAGTVVQIPSDAYGPTTMGTATYASADATQTTPLSGATVVVGPVPIVGATAPATIPTGDVSTTTNASGAFTVTVATAPAPASSSEPFVVPQNNILNFVPPATGYYIQVYGAGADGLSAGAPIPLHRFVAASSNVMLRVSTPTTAEASALVAVNSDRAANGAGPLTFDESAEEVARLHSSDEGTAGYTCHYDTHNVGPSSRYLAVGGIGLTGENLDLAGGSTPTAGFQVTEAAFLGEKTLTPPGGHYTNLVDTAHLWAGLASVQSTVYPGFYNVDYELITPSAQDAVVGSSGYTNAGACPPGTTINNS